MTEEELKIILEQHDQWLAGKGGKRANFQKANLRGVNLNGANLSMAVLKGADLREADLYGADLRRADLKSADLQDAYLWDTIGNSCEVCSMQLPVYSVAWTKDVLQIGCKQYPIEDWWTFSDNEIDDMDNGALDWWRTWNHVIKAAVETYREQVM